MYNLKKWWRASQQADFLSPELKLVKVFGKPLFKISFQSSLILFFFSNIVVPLNDSPFPTLIKLKRV